jgi:hypothetical protein
MKEKTGAGGRGSENGVNLCRDAVCTERYKRAMEGGKCPAIVDTRQPQTCHDHCAGPPKSDKL